MGCGVASAWVRAAAGWLAALAALVAFAVPARADIVVTEQVTAELVSAARAAAPGEPFAVALRLRVREGWHTYWRNPGDSGAPTTVVLDLPPGWTASEIVWPAPHLAPYGPLMNYGFEGETLYPIWITPPKSAAAGPVVLSARADWLVCKDICIPEGGRLATQVDIGPAAADPDWSGPISAALEAAPKPAADVTAAITGQGDRARLTVIGGPLPGGALSAQFFPYDGTAIDHAADQAPARGPAGLTLALTPGVAGALGAAALDGVLAFTGADGARRAIVVSAAPGPELPGADGTPIAGEGAAGAAAVSGTAPSGGLGLPLALLFAFLGGLVLNIMPCVFPVLSLKALALARGAHGGQARRHGLWFFGGVMTTFLALGATLAALSAAGQAAGWGFQLQEPWVVGGLALLFFAIGLNLLGTFDLGGGLQNVGGGLAARGGDAGAFFTGALAVVAATPCTAPFMAGALGFAATQPPAAALAIFAALGAGFAAPMLALSFSPAALDRLPRPGPWMEQAKQVLAFPMFAAAVWLAWVLTGLEGQSGLLALLAAALTLAFAVWAMGAVRSPVARYGAIGLVALLAVAAASAVQPRASALVAEPWSPARVAELRAAGQPVFVNFTADWCVTCKVNERLALSSAEVAEAFGRAGVVYLKADWTARDAAIAAELAAHGRTGVPLYLFYPPGGGPPATLAQILTPAAVIMTISGDEAARVAGAGLAEPAT